MPKMIKIGEIRVLNYFDLPWNEPIVSFLDIFFLSMCVSPPGKKILAFSARYIRACMGVALCMRTDLYPR